MSTNAIHRRASPRGQWRSGSTLLELAVASALFAILLTMCVQMLRVVSDQQRAADRRVLALQTAQNIAEQIENLPFDKLSAESAGEIKIPAAAAPFLQHAQLNIMVFDEEEPPAKRTAIELTWRDHRGHSAGPVRVTTWSFPDGSAN